MDPRLGWSHVEGEERVVFYFETDDFVLPLSFSFLFFNVLFDAAL